MRLIKTVLQNTFPNLTGPVTATQGVINNAMPVGGIILWSGATVPSGWALCNGQTVPKSDGTGNTTVPDLRDKFIVASGGAYAIGNTGGNASNTLTVAQLPSHTHSGSTDTQGSHAHGGGTSAIGDHQHSLPNLGGAQAGSDNGGVGIGVSNGYWGNTQGPTSAAGGHSHTISTDTQGAHAHNITVGNTGSGAAIENRPPYYALALIIKV